MSVPYYTVVVDVLRVTSLLQANDVPLPAKFVNRSMTTMIFESRIRGESGGGINMRHHWCNEKRTYIRARTSSPCN